MTSDDELYELFVKSLYEHYLLPNTPGGQYTLFHRKPYLGLKTRNWHEIDLSFEATVGGMQILVLIECKHYRRRVGKTIVEQLHAKTDDIGAHKGAIVTTVGFQKGALKAAKAYGIALIIAAVDDEWFKRPDSTRLFDPEWKFLNYGYIPVPFFGPWPIGCAHHARYIVQALISSLRDEAEGRVTSWRAHPHLPSEGIKIIYEDDVYDEWRRIENKGIIAPQ